MNKVFVVVRREFIERVRTKAFLIGTFLGPLLMVLLMVMPALMMSGGTRTQRIAIVDGTTDGIGARVESGLMAPTFTSDGDTLPRYDLTRVTVEPSRIEAVRDSLVALTGFSPSEQPGSFAGVLVVSDATVIEGRASYFGGNVGSIETMGRLEGSIGQAVRTARLERAGVDPAVVATAMAGTRLSTTKVEDGRATGESGEASFIMAYAMGFLLYFAIIIYGQQTATSVIEEKSSRIMEVLASSLKPFQMLMGKILGIGAVGLVQLGIWVGVAFLATSQRVRIAGLFGVDPASMQAMPIPSFPVDLLVVFLLYFALGFLLYGALFAAIGSMVNAVQEVQQVMMPVMLLVVFGFFGVFAVIKDPNAGIGLTMSFIPFFAPFVMPVRWSMASVPTSQLILSLVLMVLGLMAVAWFAGRIYRTGILMYGKKPSLKEVFRWIRAG
jgi:ABC-2 type transport system permease protein